jgi:microcystin degradation protein MlrC
MEKDGPMRIFIAGMDTETNTFAPIPTGYHSFEEMGIARGDATSKALNEPSCQLYVWRQRGRRWSRDHQAFASAPSRAASLSATCTSSSATISLRT